SAALTRHLFRLARTGGIRRDPSAPDQPHPRRARLLFRRRLPLLMARAPECAASPLRRHTYLLPLRHVRPRGPARPPARVDPAGGLRLLRAPAAPRLGPLAARRPADR